MAGLKSSAETSGKSNKAVAKPKKEQYTGKASALSAEYIVDSDSDDGLEDPNQSSKSVAGAKATNSTSSTAKNIATPPDTDLKPNNYTKAKSVKESARKTPNGSGDTKVNGSTARSTKQPEIKPSKVLETPSARAKGVSATAAAKSGVTPTSTSKANLPAGPKPQKAVECQESSDEEEEETDEESRDSTGSEREARKKAGSQSSSKASASSSKVTAPRGPATPKAPAASEAPATPKVPASKQKSDSSESSGSSTSDESSSDDEEAPATDNTKRPNQPQTPSKPTVQVYKPPPGFSPATIAHPEASHLSNLFSPTNLASKEIWHITLPAAIPISAIKNISMDKILTGGTALSHNGAEYGFVADTTTQQNRAHVLLPDPKHSNYRAVAKAITRSLHLQQSLKLPNLGKATKDNPVGTQAQSHTGKVVHEQPSGLRMRYAPFGDDIGALGLGTSSDEEREPGPAKAAFRMPPSLDVRQQQGERRADDYGGMEESAPKSTPKSSLKSSHKKRRMEEVMDHVVPETHSKKRRKKHRTDEDRETDIIEETPAKGKANGIRAPLAEANGHDESAAEPTSSAGITKKHEGETPEEKAKRKADRHQRKDEHRKRKEDKKRRKANSQDSAPSAS